MSPFSLSTRPKPYMMDLPNLPYLALLELFPMLPIDSKRTLRLVSQSYRDMIDVLYGAKFFVTLSDDTLAMVFKFNRFDLAFSPRNLYHLNVTNFLTPFTLPSTSMSRCPLPRPIHTLAFTQTLGVSERNFLKLLTFYGETNALRKLVVNLACLQDKMTSTKALKKVNMNSIQELELDLIGLSQNGNAHDMVLAFTNESYPSLQTFKIDLGLGLGVPRVLYQHLNVFISRHLKNLINLEFIHPMRYEEAIASLLLQLALLIFQVPVQPLFPTGPLRVNVLKRFEEESKLKELRMNLSSHEWPLLGVDNLGMTLVNYQKHLVILELYSYALTTTAGVLDLPRILQNCGNTLVTVKINAILWTVGGIGNHHFNLEWLESCRMLQTFEFTVQLSISGDSFVMLMNVDAIPLTLEHLVLPDRVENQDIEIMRQMLPKLQSFGFGDQIVTLEQIQMLLGVGGMPSLRKVTLMSRDFCEYEAISNWIQGLAAPNKRVTISEAQGLDDRYWYVNPRLHKKLTLEKEE